MSRIGAYGSQLVGVSLDWMEHGACRDPSLTQEQRDAYFWEYERSARKRAAALAAAERCRSCPVQADCYAYSTLNPVPAGIWAGLNDIEREAIRRQQAKRAG